MYDNKFAGAMYCHQATHYAYSSDPLAAPSFRLDRSEQHLGTNFFLSKYITNSPIRARPNIPADIPPIIRLCSLAAKVGV